MRPPKTTTIKGHTYSIGVLPTSIGQEVLVRLMRNVGPALAEGTARLSDPARFNGVPLKALGAALGDFSQRLSSADLTFVRESLGAACAVDGVKMTLAMQEAHFAGAFGEMFTWLREGVAYNYEDFFTSAENELSSLLRTPAPPAKE